MLLARCEMEKHSCLKTLTSLAFQKAAGDDYDGPQAVAQCCVEEEKHCDGLDTARPTVGSR